MSNIKGARLANIIAICTPLAPCHGMKRTWLVISATGVAVLALGAWYSASEAQTRKTAVSRVGELLHGLSTIVKATAQLAPLVENLVRLTSEQGELTRLLRAGERYLSKP